MILCISYREDFVVLSRQAQQLGNLPGYMLRGYQAPSCYSISVNKRIELVQPQPGHSHASLGVLPVQCYRRIETLPVHTAADQFQIVN